VYVVGSTLGALTPDPGLLGETDVFASRYQRKGGAPLWTRQLGTIEFDRAYGAAVDATSLYVTGTTHGTFEGQNYAGDRDAFLLRLRFT
ncbi:MAG: SBBP repeat-containing protein, partial [Actinomycetota bacterium]